MTDLNAGPVTASGPATTNAAKKATPAKVTRKAAPDTAAPAKKAAVAAPATTVEDVAQVAASTVHRTVLEVLTASPEFRATLSPEVQALLVAVRLEQRRGSLFNANGVYVGQISFTSLVGELLADVQNSAVNTVMRYLRRAGVYISAGSGARRTITFVGSKQARNLASEADRLRSAQPDSSADTGSTSAPVEANRAATAATRVPAPNPNVAAANHSAQRAQALAAMLVNCVTEDVLAKIRHDRDLLDQLIAELTHRRFTL